MVDWSKAPNWANYRTEDRNGDVWYFECSPKIDVDCGYWYADDGIERYSSIDKPVFEKWDRSLTKR